MAEGTKDKGTVLLVDRDELLLRIMRSKLERAGFEAYGVTDIEELPQAIRERSPRAVVIETLIPGEDCYAHLKQMRDEGLLEGISLMILTVLAQEDDRRRAEEFGVRRYLVKQETLFKDLLRELSEELAIRQSE